MSSLLPARLLALLQPACQYTDSADHVSVANLCSCQYHPIVTKQAKEVARTTPDCTMVSAAGLEDRGDHVHFTTDGYVQFGARYAAQWLRLQPAAE